MKKLMVILVAVTIGIGLCMADITFAAESAISPAADAPKVKLPSEAEFLELFPNAGKVDGVAVYLFGAKTVAIGPSYTVAKIKGLVNIDAQFASITKGGSYFGAAASIDIVDILKAMGKNPPSMVVAFNPNIGATIGYRTNVGDIKAGIDGGPRVNILNVDTEKLVKWIGL